MPSRHPISHAAIAAAAILLVGLFWTSPLGAQDLIEGETTVVNLRETDGRLGPLVTTLVVMGVSTLLATILFWWMTRPKRQQPGGTSHG